MSQFTRIQLLLNDEQFKRLQDAHVMIFGLGGVGGFVCEALARSGIGTLSLVDHDVIDVSNLNRQLLATHDTVGQKKVDVMKARCLAINPKLKVITHPIFYDEHSQISFEGVDYVVDAIDSVPSKLILMAKCETLSIPLIMALGTGNKLNPTELIVTQLDRTTVDPLAKKIRNLAKARGLKSVKVISSLEPPLITSQIKTDFSKVLIGSMIFVPASAGLLIASEVVKDILKMV